MTRTLRPSTLTLFYAMPPTEQRHPHSDGALSFHRAIVALGIAANNAWHAMRPFPTARSMSALVVKWGLDASLFWVVVSFKIYAIPIRLGAEQIPLINHAPFVELFALRKRRTFPRIPCRSKKLLYKLSLERQQVGTVPVSTPSSPKSSSPTLVTS